FYFKKQILTLCDALIKIFNEGCPKDDFSRRIYETIFEIKNIKFRGKNSQLRKALDTLCSKYRENKYPSQDTTVLKRQYIIQKVLMFLSEYEIEINKCDYQTLFKRRNYLKIHKLSELKKSLYPLM